jgi:hypothetical protein
MLSESRTRYLVYYQMPHKSVLRLTPELTGPADEASNIISEDDDESHAIEASGSMSG